MCILSIRIVDFQLHNLALLGYNYFKNVEGLIQVNLSCIYVCNCCTGKARSSKFECMCMYLIRIAGMLGIAV